MKRRLNVLIVSCLVATFSVHAFNYVIRFAGKGSATVVDSVLVQNLTKGTSAKVATGQQLNLTDGITTVEDLVSRDENGLKLFTDTRGSAVMEVQIPVSGPTRIDVFSSDGRMQATATAELSEGFYRYNLALPTGIALVNVKGNGFSYAGRVVNYASPVRIAGISSAILEASSESAPMRMQAVSSVSMDYSAGDRILFRGNSGTMATLVSDVLTADKTIEFNFVPCTDANGNHYATITIGEQVWMAENLKTTKYADGTDIILRASKAEYLADANRRTTPICRYFNDDPATKDIAGLAYKYQTINHKNLCPDGWHVPSHYEWRKLRDAIGPDAQSRYHAIRKTGNNSVYWLKAGATNASGFSAVGTGAFWDEWYVHSKTWAIWMASDMFNSSTTDNWFFYASTDSQLSDQSAVCEEIASSSEDFITAIRCVKNQSDSYDVLKTGEIPVGLWVTPPAAYQTNEEYKRINEMGINFVNGFHYSENVLTRLQQVLNFCHSNGLKFLANKASVANDIASYAVKPDPGLLTKFIDGIRPYASHPAFAGELLMDEPGKNLFSSIAAFTSAFQTAYPDKLAHVNLFPSYATGGIQASGYLNYIESWIQSQNPRHISFDSYPLLTNGGILNDYFYNLDLVRAKSKTVRIPFWTFIQTLSIAGTPGVPDKREPSEYDIRWQVWSNLAFGAKGIQYFTYWTPTGASEQFGQGLIGSDGQPSPRYGYAKKLNADIRTIGKILLRCDAMGVIQMAKSPYPMYSALSSFGNLMAVSGDDALIGCFLSPEGEQKLLITTLLPGVKSEITLAFSSSVSQLRIWRNNIPQTISVSNSKLELSIAPGEAALLELY